MATAKPFFPFLPFDGQEFIDRFRVKWRFDSDLQCWKRIGTCPDIPLADEGQSGLMSSKLKGFFDTIPEKGGGFAIVVDPKLATRTNDNPDGVIFGDIEFVSSTLDIKCVFADGSEIPESCFSVPFVETDEEPPGFDLNFDDNFLRQLCIEIPGGQGPQGDQGEKGDDGAPGTGDGPQGDQGDSGEDATDPVTFTGIKVEDIQDIFDSAVVNLDLDNTEGKLFITKAKVRVPTDATPADQIIASQTTRSVEFNEGFDFNILKPASDPLDTDLTISSYPSSFTSDSDLEETSLVARKLSGFLTEVTDFYQVRLDEIAADYDDQLEKFIKGTDAAAREKLDILTEELANCEFQLPIEYCVGISPQECGGQGSDSVEALCALAGFLTGDADFCSESEGDDLGSNTLGSNEGVSITFSFTGQPSSATLPSGVYMIIYTGGAFLDNDDPGRGFFVDATLNVTSPGGVTSTLTFPEPSEPFNSFDKASLENAYLAGPLSDRAFVVKFDADGGGLALGSATGTDLTGDMKFHSVKCNECPP